MAEKLKSELSKLPINERAELARYLILSLDDGTDADAESAWDAELEHRALEIREGTAAGESAEQVFGQLRKRYS